MNGVDQERGGRCVQTQGLHRLQRISTFYTSTPGVTNVIRWCQCCGAIVIDTDVDNRTVNGDVLPMQFPKIAHDATLKRQQST